MFVLFAFVFKYVCICCVVEQRDTESIETVGGGVMATNVCGKSGIFVSAPNQNDIESDI